MNRDEARRKAAAKNWLVSFDEGFNQGWDARDAKQCVWVEKPWHFNTTCGAKMMDYEAPKFCAACGGRISIKEAK